MSKAQKSTPSKKQVKPAKAAIDSGSSNQPEMKTSEIRDLIDFISKSGLNEVNIETKELKLQVKREPDQKVFKSTPVMAPMAAPVMSSTPAPSSAPQPIKAEKISAEASGKKTAEIK